MMTDNDLRALAVLLLAPVPVGLLCGACGGQRGRFSWVVVALAPVVSAALVCGWAFAVNLADISRDPGGGGNPNPVLVQALAATALVAPAVLVWGALPAAASGALAQWCKSRMTPGSRRQE